MECVVREKEKHKKEMMAVQDSMDVLSGKWKISIISSICYYNERRFSDILNDVVGISNKMLSKELKELEVNKLRLTELTQKDNRQHKRLVARPPHPGRPAQRQLAQAPGALLGHVDQFHEQDRGQGNP